MPKDKQRASGPEVRFVWDSLKGTAKASAAPEPRDAVERRRGSRRRSLLIGSGALVLVAGAVYGAATLSTHQHTATAGTAAMTLPGSLLPTQGGLSGASASPSSHPYASRSATPDKSKASATTRKNTATAQTPDSAAASRSHAAADPAVIGASAAVPATAEPPAPNPVGDWLLNQTAGNVAVDSTGAHDGMAEDGWWAGTALLVNGTNSQMYTDGPVLSTGSGASFTVSAWVDMTALPASGQYDETAVSQDGGENSGFYLQFTEPADRWAFSRTSNNSDSPTAYRALSASAPALDTWTHLVGVYNAADHTQYLYVNGAEQGTATDSTPFSSTGDLAIGRAQYAGQDTDWLKGAIKGVEVFNTALSAAQVSALS
jgi:hypothetical protein